jgi:hypothetical protein
MMSRSSRSSQFLKWVPLLGSGLVIFLGLVMLGGTIGLLWHPFKTWIVLDVHVFGGTGDWIAWGVSFIISATPIFLAIIRRRIVLDLTLALTSLVLPVVSVAIMTQWYPVGAAALIGSGLLLSHTLVSNSEQILGIEKGTALRTVASEVFALLSVISMGGIVSLLIWQDGFFSALISGSYISPRDVWLHMLGVDVEVFYLARPVLSGILIVLGLVAIVALFREPLACVARLLPMNRDKPQGPVGLSSHTISKHGQAMRILGHRSLPYLVLLGSMILGAAITLYPYLSRETMTLFGSDAWFYIDRMRFFTNITEAMRNMESDRGLFVIILIAAKISTGASPESVVRFTPPFVVALLALGTFMLVREGTSRPWLASFAALLSVASAQTTLGMAAGILANWFGLAVATFMFALAVRAIRLRSTIAFLLALVLSVILIGSYSYLWITAIAALCLAVVSSVFAFRSLSTREWIPETGITAIMFVGVMFAPVVALYLISAVGVQPATFDPNVWFQVGWNYLQGQMSAGTVGSALAGLEQAFDFAGNRVDLPFLTLLSVVGLADTEMLDRSFRRIVAGMVVVSLVFTILSPDIFLTWRGLFILPLYLTGALGAASVIRRVNRFGVSPDRRTQLAFAATFSVYLFLSLLSYSLRAIELLIWESHF